MTDTPLELATLLLLVAPLAGAGLLWVGPRRPAWRAGIAIVAVSLLVMGLALAIGTTTGAPSGRLVVPATLGILDAPPSDIVWTLAPMAIALLFVTIAIRARRLPLAGLAVLQLAIVLPAVARDLAEPGNAGPSAGLVFDPLALALLAVSVLVGGLVVIFAIGYEPVHLRHIGQETGRSSAFLGWLLMFLAAMHLLVLADDLRLLAVGWELTTLCSFVLIGFDHDDAAVSSARRALAYNLFGGAGLAAGLWLAGSHATLSGILASPGAAGLTAILAFFVIAAATKSALAPFHPWLLGAMVAAAPVSALLHASTMVKAGSYLLLRLSPAFTDQWLGLVVTAVGAFSFAGAAFLALRERDLKRVLALSTVASLGMIAAAAGMGSPLALAAGIVFLLLHAAAKALAFLVVGATEQSTGTRDLEALVGIGRAKLSLAGPLLLAAAAMALPPFGIAVAKWALLLEGGSQVVVVPILAVGAAANVALWASVAGRILVRRASHLRFEDHIGMAEWVAIGTLTVATLGGIALTAPLAAAVADPAAAAAFGAAAPLADGWNLSAMGGLFPVVPLALVVTGVLVGAAWYVRRLALSPQPYLSGVNVGAPAAMTFHDARGEARIAASGGFYWGGAMGDASHPERLRRGIEIGGWIGVTAVGLVAAFGMLGML